MVMMMMIIISIILLVGTSRTNHTNMPTTNGVARKVVGTPMAGKIRNTYLTGGSVGADFVLGCHGSHIGIGISIMISIRIIRIRRRK
jgi:hypothetical protein